MIKNYLKTAVRNLWKNRSYSFLNIAGLAIGIACAALIFLWVEDELTYDHFFPNRENLYKIKDKQTYDGTTFTFDATPGPLAASMKQEIPGVKNTARTSWTTRNLFGVDEKNIYEMGLYADPAFLSMFQMPFVKGQSSTALEPLHAIVISEKMAEKFFGNTDVVGKSLQMNHDENFTITGVFRDLPDNVSLRFDWLVPFRNFENQNSWLEGWGNNGIRTFVELEPGTNPAVVNKKLEGYVKSKNADAAAEMSVYPMSRWRLYDNFENGNEVPGRIRYVNLFSLIAWIILIIACINFMNLATARSEQRAREVGVRKVLGAGRSRLITQFLSEAVIMAFLATLLAIGILYAALPSFNTLVEKQLTPGLGEPLHWLALLTITLVCGIFAGSYPAFYLSSFNPIGVLKGLRIASGGSAAFIRKGLVVLQFSISVILIISTLLIYRQIKFVQDRNLGFNRENLMYLGLNGNMKNSFGALRNEILQTGYADDASLSSSMVLQLGNNTADFSWEGKDPSRQVLISVENVTPGYIHTMGMQLKEGRDFYSDIKSDSNNIIINEALAKTIKKKDVVGSQLLRGDAQYTIVGVVKDFVYNDMYGDAAPLLLSPDTSNVNFLTVRLKPGANFSAALPAVEQAIKNINPGYPVEYRFVDEQFHQLFKTESLIGTLAGVFAVLAIIISCLGLFGLAAFTAERRTKEIGIRKVLGASVGSVAGLLSKDFLFLVGISCLVAFPVAWWIMHQWLQNFEYRIGISWWIFPAAAVLALSIALLTVSFQAVRAALTNPVKNLRTE